MEPQKIEETIDGQWVEYAQFSTDRRDEKKEIVYRWKGYSYIYPDEGDDDTAVELDVSVYANTLNEARRRMGYWIRKMKEIKAAESKSSS